MTESAASRVRERLDLATLRGEVTTVAQGLEETPACEPRDMAVAWLCASLDEAAVVLRQTLDAPIDERADLVAQIETASERLFELEVGDAP